MTAIQLPCDQCGSTITSDAHWPHESYCDGVTDPACVCAALTCAGCCWECRDASSDSPRDSGTSDGEVGTLPTSPIPDGGAARTPPGTPTGEDVARPPASSAAVSPRKAITNGACDNGDGLSSPSPPSAPAERRKRETSETGAPRMGRTTAVTNEEAPAQRDLPGA